MTDIDSIAEEHLECARSFLEKSRSVDEGFPQQAYLKASLLLLFSSVEAHVNSISDEFSSRDEFSPHEKGILLEKKVELKDGKFVITDRSQFSRLTEKIELIANFFSGENIKEADFWPSFKGALKRRNDIVHPQESHSLSYDDVESAILSAINLLDFLYQAVYRRKFPSLMRSASPKHTL